MQQPSTKQKNRELHAHSRNSYKGLTLQQYFQITAAEPINDAIEEESASSLQAATPSFGLKSIANKPSNTTRRKKIKSQLHEINYSKADITIDNTMIRSKPKRNNNPSNKYFVKLPQLYDRQHSKISPEPNINPKVNLKPQHINIPNKNRQSSKLNSLRATITNGDVSLNSSQILQQSIVNRPQGGRIHVAVRNKVLSTLFYKNYLVNYHRQSQAKQTQDDDKQHLYVRNRTKTEMQAFEFDTPQKQKSFEHYSPDICQMRSNANKVKMRKKK